MADAALPPDEEGSGGGTNDFYNNQDVYFMGIALLCEKRSKDPRRQVGACVVSEDGHRVIGTGYNGMPLYCNDCLMPWKKKRKIENKDGPGQQGKEEESEKHDYVCHAEMNALVNMDSKSVQGGTLYVTLFPCNECAKIIVRSGIAKVVYLSDDKQEEEAFKAGRKLLTKKLGTDRLLQFNKYEEPTKQVLDFMDGITKKKSASDATNTRKGREKQKITWEQFFMALAKLSAERSNNAKQGVCIVNVDKRIVGLGYLNHDLMQQDHAEQDDSLYVCHAPVNAIVNENPTSLRGCTMYVTHFPCKECAKVIVQSGIRKIVFLEKIEVKNEEMSLKILPEGCYVAKPCSPKEKKSGKGKQDEEVDATTRMFAIARIETKKYSIEIALDDFNNWKNMYAIAQGVSDKYEIECNLGDIKDWRRMFAIALEKAEKDKDDINEIINDINKGKKFAEDLALKTEIELDYAKVIKKKSSPSEAPSNPTGETS